MVNTGFFILIESASFLKIALLKLLIASLVSDVTKGPRIIYVRVE